MSIFYLELIIALNDVETLLKISNNFLKKNILIELNPIQDALFGAAHIWGRG